MKWISWMSVLTLSLSAYAQVDLTGKPTSELIHFNCSTCDNKSFFISLPEGYMDPANAGKQYPMMVFIHGHGEGFAPGESVASRITKLQRHGPPKHRYILNGKTPVTVNGQQKKYEFIIIAPQTHKDSGGVEYAVASGYDPVTGEPIYTKNNKEIISAYDFAVKNFRVNKNKVYVTGLSQGGAGSWRFTVKYPHLIAAAAPIAGNYNINVDICRAKNVPIWAFHGDKDTAVSYYTGKKAVTSVNACSGPDLATLSTFPGYGHDTWSNTYKNFGTDIVGTPEYEGTSLYEWLLSHSLNGQEEPAPEPAPINTAPVIASIQNKSVDEGKTLTVHFSASDADGDQIALSLQGLPSFGSFSDTGNGSAQLTLNPQDGHAGTYSLTLKASDGKLSSQKSFQVSVKEVLPPPSDEEEDPTLLSHGLSASAYTASSTDGSNYARLAFDGSVELTSRWLSKNTNGPHYLSVKLPVASKLSKIIVKSGWKNEFAIKDFELEYFDGESWNLIPETRVRGNGYNSVEVSLPIQGSFITDSVRLKVLDNGYVRIKELEIYGVENAPTQEITNIALGKEISASSVHSNYVASKAVDGVINDSSRWVSALRSGETLSVDLGVDHQISKIVVYTGYLSAYAMKSFKLEYFDGSAWKLIPGGAISGNPAGNQVVTVEFSSVKAQKVKLTGLDNDNHRVREIQIFGFEE